MAIAYDTVGGANMGIGASTLTYSHTCSGSNRLLVVGVQLTTLTNRTISGVTYNGVAMTALFNYYAVNNSRANAFFYLLNPASGANNVVVTLSNTCDYVCNSVSLSYTGVKQSGFPDASGKTDALSGLHSSTTQAVTTTADNCWLVGFTWNSGSPTQSVSGGTGTTQRGLQKNSGSYDSMAGSDSNGAKTPAGSYSLTTNFSDSNTGNSLMVASFAPYVTPPPSNGNFLMFM